MTTRKPVLLCILDGWGLNPVTENNAIAMADTPHFDALWRDYPHTTLRADGFAVGLPEGQFGNSEVGHMNIGAGRVVMQDLPRITQSIADGSLAQNAELADFIARLKETGGSAHVMGLVSDGGVHAHQDHIASVISILSMHDIPVIAHIFTDGRDTPPASAKALVEGFLNSMTTLKNVRVGTVSGRFYAMDRDNRWERVEAAWQAIVNAQGLKAAHATEAITASYERNEQDEFIKPTVIGEYDGFKPQDGLFMANFRADRAREILHALVDPHFTGFDRGMFVPSAVNLGMVEYSAELNAHMKTAFPSISMDDLLGETVARAGLRQLRAAETEKYPHVTFFFNGGREEAFPNEERILVPSPKVATYDLQPEMSAGELTDRMVEAIHGGTFDFLVLNYANPDMVGHTGDIPAAIKAVETVDACLGRIADAVRAMNGVLLVTADHGNADQMVDPITGEPHTAHTTNPVPFIVVGAPHVTSLKDVGKLGDIAPTALSLLGLPRPQAMTGDDLINAA